MNKTCTSFAGHRYEPRYDTRPPQEVGPVKGDARGIVAFVEAMTTKVYVRDVCVRCGDTVNRKQE